MDPAQRLDPASLPREHDAYLDPSVLGLDIQGLLSGRVEGSVMDEAVE